MRASVRRVSETTDRLAGRNSMRGKISMPGASKASGGSSGTIWDAAGVTHADKQKKDDALAWGDEMEAAVSQVMRLSGRKSARE